MGAGESATAYSLSFSNVELLRLKSRDILRLRLLVEPRAARRWSGVCDEGSCSVALSEDDNPSVTSGAGGAEVCGVNNGALFALEVGGFWAVWAR